MRRPKTYESSSTSIFGQWYGVIAVAAEESGLTGCGTATMAVVFDASDTDELDLIIVVSGWNACSCGLIIWKSGHNAAISAAAPFGNMRWPFAAASELSRIFATIALIVLPRVTNDTRHNQISQVV